MSALAKKVVPVFFVPLLLVAGVLVVSAQQSSSPRFLFSWQTNTYAPSGFEGKVLPSPGAPITVSFEIVQGGKLANLQEVKRGNVVIKPAQTIYWYVNDALVSNIPGKQTITFTAPSFSDVVNVRAQLPDYAGGFLFQSVKIPVVRPEVVIESSYPGGNFTGLSARVRGVPYFFNVRDLSALNFAWRVNGETPAGAEDPTNLSVNLNPDAPPGSTLTIGLTIQDPSDEDSLLTASANTTLTYIK